LFLVRPGLDRAEVVRTPPAMVNKVALAESLLEVLTRLRVKTALLLLLAVAGARAFGGETPSFFSVRAAHHQVVGIYFASLC